MFGVVFTAMAIFLFKMLKLLWDAYLEYFIDEQCDKYTTQIYHDRDIANLRCRIEQLESKLSMTKTVYVGRK